MLQVSESYVNLTRGSRYGDSGWQNAFTENRGELFRSCQREYGRCTGTIYVDGPDGATPVGWTFVKRVTYENSEETYLREVWVETREER